MVCTDLPLSVEDDPAMIDIIRSSIFLFDFPWKAEKFARFCIGDLKLKTQVESNNSKRH